MNQALFRKQALESQGEKLWGELILSQPLSTTFLVGFLATLTTVALLFLATTSYKRKVSVEGRLLPDRGVIEVAAPSSGQVAKLFVVPDQLVQAGEPLFELRLDHTLDNATALSELLLARLHEQEQNLQRQVQLQDAAVANISTSKAEQEALLLATRKQLEHMLAQEQALLEVKNRALERARSLNGQGMLALADVEAVQAQALQQQQACNELQLQLLQTRTRLQDLESENNAQLLQGFQQSERLAAELSELQQRKLRLTAEQRTVVSAPLTARVSNIHVQPGMMAAQGHAVLALLPQASKLQAELLVPSAAVGFIAKNQRVNIRFDAFPYQKFGMQQGKVLAVTQSTELQQQNQSQGMAVYRAIAELNKQTVSAYGVEEPLRAGMQFSADVVLDERSLLEWLLEPLFSIRGMAP